MHDSVGAFAQCNSDMLQWAAAGLSSLQGPWILGGDWNCAPADLAATGWLELAGGVVYDYFIVSKRFAHAVHSVHAVPDGHFEPHCAVRLFLRAAPRCIMVRNIRRHKSFGSTLPPRPSEETVAVAAQHAMADATSVDALDVDAQYTK